MKAFDYSGAITSRRISDFGQEYAGPIYAPRFPKYGYIIHTVAIHEQYRPDKIAYLYYGDVDLHWVLDVANHFYNGFSEYTEGTEIKIPTMDALFEMGIISNNEV